MCRIVFMENFFRARLILQRNQSNAPLCPKLAGRGTGGSRGLFSQFQRGRSRKRRPQRVSLRHVLHSNSNRGVMNQTLRIRCGDRPPLFIPPSRTNGVTWKLFLSVLRRRQSFQIADRHATDPRAGSSASCRKCGSPEFWRKPQVAEAPIRVRLSRHR